MEPGPAAAYNSIRTRRPHAKEIEEKGVGAICGNESQAEMEAEEEEYDDLGLPKKFISD